MPIPAKMTIDGTGLTPCTLELYVSGIPVTFISYIGGIYSLPARNFPISVSQGDFSESMRGITQWQGILRSIWSLPILPTTHEWRCKRSLTQWDFTKDFGGPKIVDATKVFVTPTVTFKQRQAFALDPSQFDSYWQTLVSIMSLAF